MHAGRMDASLLEHSLDGVLFLDREGAILTANAIARARLGEVAGRHLTDFVGSAAATHVAEALSRAAASGARQVVEVPLRCETGEEPAALALSWLPGQDAFLAIVREASPVAAIAHDLNNILTVVAGHAELVLEDLQAAKAPDESVRTIQRSAVKARTLTARLLGHTRGEPAKPAAGAAPPVPAIPPRVLLVDDDPMVRGLVERMLVRSGYHVVATGDVGEAMRLIDDASTEIDLLLTDLDLQPGSGSDLARAFADRRPGARVLYMTGSLPPGEKTVRPAPGAPEAPMIQKPFTSHELILSVRQLLPAPPS
jgi:CheY-like chemotaxis protein